MTDQQFAPAVVACVDIGSPKKGNVGWSMLHGETQATGRDLPAFIDPVPPHRIKQKVAPRIRSVPHAFARDRIQGDFFEELRS